MATCNGCIRPSAGTRSRENGYPGVFEQTRAPSPFKFHTGRFLRPTWLGYMYGYMCEKSTIDRLVDYRPEKADYRLSTIFLSRLSTIDFWFFFKVDYRLSTFGLWQSTIDAENRLWFYTKSALKFYFIWTLASIFPVVRTLDTGVGGADFLDLVRLSNKLISGRLSTMDFCNIFWKSTIDF